MNDAVLNVILAYEAYRDSEAGDGTFADKHMEALLAALKILVEEKT